MAEPVVIPAFMNPRPPLPGSSATYLEANSEGEVISVAVDNEISAGAVPELCKDFEYDYVPDVGQDKLDMVIPQGLTVRMVAELYGPEEKVEVIDVKNQEGEDKRWNMRQWADYYEATGQKPVRNVISLEVSQSKLGRLIRRPKIVRDLDLQDSVWPADEQAKGIFPKVQFYCLMSVANCYTDFHIDFGGSSVYYHILHGSKTFFFIPPKKEHLKKYEEWCLSSEQNSIFLGDWTKECYRVDLQAGDTMLIPSGWIHAVWTPVDTLVIGGNFLTRMHYGMQIQINEIEKNTGVGRKFRYPHFQKVLWYTVIRYLERDPLPSSVAQTLLEHKQFVRDSPVWHDFYAGEDASAEGSELYNERYYSQGEIEGLPDLIRYIFRTVMISLGKVQGVTKTTQEAVTRSLPKGYGDYLEIASTFAMWAAWKRGNEDLPAWAYPDAIIADVESGASDRKMTAAALKRIERQTGKSQSASDRRQSARHAANMTITKEVSLQPEGVRESTPATIPDSTKESAFKRACDACRKRRMRCEHSHEDVVVVLDLTKRFGVRMTDFAGQVQALGSQAAPEPSPIEVETIQPQLAPTSVAPMAPMMAPVAPMLSMQSQPSVAPAKVPEIMPIPSHVDMSGSTKKSRVKACEECRKTKVCHSVSSKIQANADVLSGDASTMLMVKSTLSSSWRLRYLEIRSARWKVISLAPIARKRSEFRTSLLLSLH
jgi:F-box/leucine-rich repeat protein 10/11